MLYILAVLAGVMLYVGIKRHNDYLVGAALGCVLLAGAIVNG